VIALVRGVVAGLVLLSMTVPSAAATSPQQDWYGAVALAYDHLKRETGDSLGYNQVIYRPDDPDGMNTPAMRDWKRVEPHIPSDMASLVGRCLPPVMEARALQTEGGAILASRGDVRAVNANMTRATALLHSVDDCWQQMAKLAEARRCFPTHSWDGQGLRPYAVVADTFSSGVRIIPDDKGQNCSKKPPFQIGVQQNAPYDPARDPGGYGRPQQPKVAPPAKPKHKPIPAKIAQNDQPIPAQPNNPPPKKALPPINEDPKWDPWHRQVYDRLTNGLVQMPACDGALSVDYTITKHSYGYTVSALSDPRLTNCELVVALILENHIPRFPDNRCTAVTLTLKLSGGKVLYDPTWTAICK
jgi:hypothetical protein